MPNDSATPDAPQMPGVLSDRDILQRLGRDLIIHPLLDLSQVHICKVDLRLDTVFFEVQASALAAYDQLFKPVAEHRRRVELPPGVPYVLHPGQLALAPTYEHVSLPNDLLGLLQGRSSLARLGVVVHATAGFVDPGFKGPLTLELSNLGDLPVKLYPLSRVAAIAFIKLIDVPLRSYDQPSPSPIEPGTSLPPKYSGTVSHPSRYEQDWENEILRLLATDAREHPSQQQMH